MNEAYFTIVNGAAGGGRCRAAADATLRELKAAGLSLDVHLTEGVGHASELAQDAYADGHRRFLAVGGDGTSYEIINGLFPAAHETSEAESDDRVTLGMLPLGTGNSFLRDFGVTNEAAAKQALTRGDTRPVDLVRVTHRDGVLYSLNTLGLGFVPRVGALTNDRFKPLGPAGYIAAVVTCTVSLEHPVIRYRLDDDDHPRAEPAALISFSNSKFTGGGMMMAPAAEIDDGALDVTRVNDVSRRTLIATFPKIYNGTFIDHPQVEEARAKKVTFEDVVERDVLVDGELKRLALVSLEVVPSALMVVA